MDDRQTDGRRRHIRDRGGEELLFNQTLGANLKARRLAAGWTQDQLALQAGLTRGSIANIERGEQVPGLFRLTVICAAMGCELVDVLPSGEVPAQRVADTLGDKYSSAVQRAKQESLRRSRVTAAS
ncbi:helix-turn-helix transcriptional regulator [Nocardioides rubriscoriae]|uniref:helix-turn-helix transcriptional regulator n=1 Tax=Nocardioides rubriscoriae TaxID=642762 RepID=UPI001479199B|nr:helix-turn-helix transcriptional regulator [Nocardioides rubriscoriae]